MDRDSDAGPGGRRRELASSGMVDLAEEAAPPMGDAASQRTHVLLVEDDPLFTDLVASILSEAGGDLDVVSASRLSSALAHLVRGDAIGLILADLSLPDSSGAATVGFLRRAAPAIPIIVLSADDDVQVALEAIREGADEYVVKGRFSVDSLVWLVRLVLERHRRSDTDRGGGPVDRPRGFEDLAGLQVVGRHLIHLAERTGMHLGVVVLAVHAAPRSEWADWERLLGWVSDLLERTLRRCDVLSRTGRTELAAVLVGNGPLGGAVERLRAAIVEGGAGAHVRVGFAALDPGSRTRLDMLLEHARRDANPVLTSRCEAGPPVVPI